ncbi:16S rRNA (cytosine(1402)-N(4))-methyltransferase RsmH [Elusimicrobiota bacterium]
MCKKIYHKPVMAEEVIKSLNLTGGCKIIDGTVGEGGHSLLIASKIAPSGLLIGIDKDVDNIKVSQSRLSSENLEFRLFCDSYSNIKKIMRKMSIKAVNGVLLDLGFSMRHIKHSGRGFTFLNSESLDMRYNTNTGIPAHDWLNKAHAAEIANVLWTYGQERESRSISEAIVYHRSKRQIHTSKQLADIILYAKRKSSKKIHPATKSFQAIRIYINNELDELKTGLEESIRILLPGGRLSVLTYHSIEDRIVRDFMLKYAGKCLCPSGFPVCKCGAGDRHPRVRILKKYGSRPGPEEVIANKSSRSAHLRVCEVMNDEQ